jgi:integrase
MDNLNIPIIFTDENWQACFTSFITEMHNRSGSRDTVASYIGHLSRFFAHHRDPQQVSRADISQFVNAPAQTRGAKAHTPMVSTINVRTAALRSFYNFSSSFTILQGNRPEPLFQQANPCQGIKFGKADRHYKALSAEEIRRFFSSIDRSTPIGKRDYALFSFMLVSARRRAAVARLRYGDLEQALIADENGASHMGWLYKFREKGSSGVQDSSEIPASVVALIFDYLQEVLPSWPPAEKTPLWIAIGRGDGGGNVKPGEIRPLATHSMENCLKKHAKAAGIDPHKISLHSWRHSSAKMRRLQGSTIPEISQVLRHSSWDMTRRYVGTLVTQSDSGGVLLESALSQLGVL